jgi:hypothetical protein
VPGITRDNHYVPIGLLRHWTTDGTHLYAYRLLVSRAEVPEWSQKRVRGIAKQEDLYMTLALLDCLDEARPALLPA